jgi:glycosyltransferase involved in cell wall biosynthesis
MKVAMIISSLEVGGAEKLVIDLSNRISKFCDLKLYIIKENKSSILDKAVAVLNIKVVYLNSKLRFFDLRAANILKKELDSFKPDIIHTHLKTSSYIYYYYLFKKDFFWFHTVHTLARVDTRFIRRRLFKKLYSSKKIVLVAVSNTVRQSLIKEFPKAEIKLIENGIDVSEYYYCSGLKDKQNIICVARLTYLKNHEYLIKEFVKVRDNNMKLILIGDGKEKKRILKLINLLNINDRVILINSTMNVSSYLRDSSIFVLPSLYEGLSLSILEALATGLIVVTSRASSELIDDGVNGYISDLSENSLYKVLTYIIDNNDHLDYIRENARIKAENYSIESMTKKYYELFLGKTNV